MQKNQSKLSFSMWAGTILTPLRLCMGWIIFSAFWRRLILKPEALDIHSPLYEGLKFNHFIPSATGLSSFIKYLVLHPELLFIFLWIFTIIEGIVGLCLLWGLFTRLASLISFCLLLGIMLGAGWLGTTCVDEWQIGVFGTASSLVLFLGGGGLFSLDYSLAYRYPSFQRGFWSFWTSGPLFRKNEESKTYKLAIIFSCLGLGLALITNQINVGGVWGPFKNKAIKPHLTLSDLSLDKQGVLKMKVFRDAGPDTYGSFIVSVKVLNEQGKAILDFDPSYLGSMPKEQIENHYLVQVHPNKRSLVVPLGAFATVKLAPPNIQQIPPGNYFVEVTDVDGSTWKAPVKLDPSISH